jgi:hypothetical protein
MRTTVALDNFLLRKVKTLSHKEGKSLKETIGELLLVGLKAKEKGSAASAKVRWHTQPMGAKFDIADKDLLHKALDGDR